jgi:hypothetical protein
MISGCGLWAVTTRTWTGKKEEQTLFEAPALARRICMICDTPSCSTCVDLKFIFKEHAHSSLVFSFCLFLYPVLHAASDSQEPHQLQISQISYKNNYTSILYPKFKMVAMHENFYARNGVEGRDHIPALPFWMAIVRIVQFVCHLQYALPQMHI